MLDSLVNIFIDYGYIAVFTVLILCGFGLPIPEDITLVAGGIISSMACQATDNSFLDILKHCDQVHSMFAVSMAGVLLGDSVVFFLGRFFGVRLFKIRFFSKIVTTERYEWAQKRFEKYGIGVIFAARFMPGLRSPIFIISGITKKVSYLKFLITDACAALISVPLWVYLGFWGERQLSDMGVLEHYVKRGQIGIMSIVGAAVLILAIFWFIKRKIKAKTKLD